ncbi:hypothetical protein SARC_09720, partial [Sphaeroforma arctica JP610]
DSIDESIELGVAYTLVDAGKANTIVLGSVVHVQVRMTIKRMNEPLDKEVTADAALVMDLTNSMGRVIDEITRLTEKTFMMDTVAKPSDYVRKRSSVTDAIEIRAVVTATSSAGVPHANRDETTQNCGSKSARACAASDCRQWERV